MHIWNLFQSNESVRLTIERLQCLPYFPPAIIPEVFDLIKANDENLQGLFEYIDNNWISGKFFSPAVWSIYGKATRTNNDAEGQHNKWNSELPENPPFYLLVEYLYGLATDLPQNAQLLCHGLLKQEQRLQTREKKQNLFKFCKMFADAEITAIELLEHLLLICKRKTAVAAV